ncbi:MAG: type II toxin-antitoxin system RelE/ParE family toxin [Acidobacteriota bacterium]|nr:type II toxin-antitoxin system RelE/ParE family toxin [Acidobacteriota bacterium]
MKEIRRTEAYIDWYDALANRQAKYRIFIRTKRLAEGNPGDHRFLGDMVSEMRIDCGPGYRVYYKETEAELILLLCGGDKKTQKQDIVKAKRLAKEI